MIFFLFGFIWGTNAALVDQGDGTLRDGNLLWHQDLADFISLNYGEQVAAINASPLAGGSWIMATASEMNQLRANNTNTQIQANFLPAYAASSREYCYGRYDSVSGTNSHYAFRLWYRSTDNTYQYGTLPEESLDDSSRSIFLERGQRRSFPFHLHYGFSVLAWSIL